MNDLFLGIMSGTSLDGIDVAICDLDSGTPKLISFYSSEWPVELRTKLFDLATAEKVEMDSLVRAHFELAREYGSAVKGALADAKIPSSRIRALGLHGQTVRHLPTPPHPGTLQLGSGAALAAIAGIDVVSDFRSADIALGGQGAPLMPMFDYQFLRSESVNRLIVNIGGIANVTWLPRNAREENVLAFDTGPGNMLLDALARKYFDRPFDAGGEIARNGKVDDVLTNELLSNAYFKLAPPKSTGRELFSEHFLLPIHEKIAAKNLTPSGALATLTEVTARSIARSLDLVHANSDPVEIIVSGGGAFNQYLLKRLAINAGSSVSVITSEEFGIPAKAKEAIAFAFFAKAFLEELPIHLPSTTGASRRAILGSLSRGVR